MVQQGWITTKEINLYLHWVTHPAKDVYIIPSFLIVITRWIVVDAHLMIDITIKIGLLICSTNSLKCRQLTYFLCMEVSWFIKN